MKAYILVFFFLSTLVLAAEDRVAIGGYDTVAYFTESKALRGDPEIYMNWDGKKWLFSSEENLQLFLEDPDYYTPYFGEHCANGLSDGHAVYANPRNWLIDDGRLFLFFSNRGKNSWLVDDLEEEVKKAEDYIQRP